MPAKATKKTVTAKPKPKARTARSSTALDGLQGSLDDAQKALAELRGDLSTGGRRLVKDIEAAVRNARRDLGRTRKAIQQDLGGLGDALKPRRPAAKPASRATKATAKPKPASRATKATAKPKPKPRASGRARSS
jgi:hypothetical protein